MNEILRPGMVLGGAYGYAGGKYYEVVRATDKTAWIREMGTIVSPSPTDIQWGRTSAGSRDPNARVQRCKIHYRPGGGAYVKPQGWTICDVAGGRDGHDYWPD